MTACLSIEQEKERRELMDRQGQGQEECCLNVCMVMERRRRGVMQECFSSCLTEKRSCVVCHPVHQKREREENGQEKRRTGVFPACLYIRHEKERNIVCLPV